MLVLMGLNHRSAPLHLREKMVFPENELPGELRRLTALEGIREAMILSTCNRVEILCRVEDPVGETEILKKFLSERRGISGEDQQRYGYRYSGTEAARHLFRVANGLDSMVLGEPQILGQVRKAYAAAREAGSAGAILDQLLRRCLSSAKRIRTDTGISRHSVSIAYTAVQLARKIFGDLNGCSALLLGAGKMGGLVATHLAASGVDSLTVASRTYNHASTFATEHDATACTWDELFSQLDRVDIVVTGTASLTPVLTRETVRSAMKERRSEPLFIIDIAVPRDVDPDVNRLDNVYLYDIDDLQGLVDDNLEERMKAAEVAEGMVLQEVKRFERWLGALEVTPVIVSLREMLHMVSEAEVERFKTRLGSMTADQEQQVRNLARSLVQKILHRPIRHLKQVAEEGDAVAVSDLYHRIFGIPMNTNDNGEPDR